MTRNYLRLPEAVAWGSPYNTGDGIRLGQKVGADLSHPYNYMASPGIKTPPYAGGEDAQVKDDRSILVGADGRRFADETIGTRQGKAVQRGGFDFFPGHPMWAVFDQEGLDAGPLVFPREHFAVGWLKQTERYEWSGDNQAEVAKGWIAASDTLEGLATELGIDPAVRAEVDAYNSWADRGVDDPRFGRSAARMRPIRTAPFYGYAWGQLLITTLGGLRKDGEARVLDPDGVPVAGLYAAGDVASSYTWTLSGGMGLGDALAFGRIAGKNVAAEPHRS